jgi:hypothetical protein
MLSIGVFALDGIIFRLHLDVDLAVRDVIFSAGNGPVAQFFKFKRTCLSFGHPRPKTSSTDMHSPRAEQLACNNGTRGGVQHPDRSLVWCVKGPKKPSPAPPS